MGKTKKGGKTPLGEKIARLAKERGFLKPVDVANEHGIKVSTFNDLIYGNTKIYPDSLVEIAKALGVEPWELLSPQSTQRLEKRERSIVEVADIIEALLREDSDDILTAIRGILRVTGLEASAAEDQKNLA